MMKSESPVVLMTEPDEPEDVMPTMSFIAAMQSVIDGKHVTRKAWKDERIVMYLDEHLKITLPSNLYKPSDLILSDGDMRNNDWYIV
jgi:hypothetical protein